MTPPTGARPAKIPDMWMERSAAVLSSRRLHCCIGRADWKSSWKKKVFSVHDQEFKDQPYEIADESPLLSYIRTLPPKHRTAIYLFYYEDMPVNRIASAMGANQNTVLSWLRRGRKALEKMIKEEV